MKPSEIYDVLDLAREVRKNNDVFNPLFVGAPGVGKSHIVQAWAKERKLPFIDLRAAYLEAPDMIGFPSVETVKNRQVTKHNLPEFWPTEGEGVLLLEEPNRGQTSIMNTFMQLLTDRRVHNYELPAGWMIVGCINPEGSEYDVNTMDSALKNRFQIFDVSYDKNSFLDYMKREQWNKTVIAFVESGAFQYKLPEELGDAPGVQYVSPRTFSALNAVLKAGIKKPMELTVYQTVLGKNVGKDFYQFVNERSPVFYKDLIKDRKKALKKLEGYSQVDNLDNGMISITLTDIVENMDKAKPIDEDLLHDVMMVIPTDMSPGLMYDIGRKFGGTQISLLEKMTKNYPDLAKKMKSNLKSGA